MLSKLRPRLTYANVVSSVCLFILLGGTAFAAAKAITGKEVKNGSLSGKDVRNSSLTGLDVKNESLSADDFSGSVEGPKGDIGPRGPKGDTGTVNTSNFYDKAQTDARVRSNVFFREPGEYTFTVPVGVTSILAEVRGGGGGGSWVVTGGGGGQGGYARAQIPANPGQTWTIIVGVGGPSGTGLSVNGVPGGGTSISNGATPLLSAAGGEGGTDTQGGGGGEPIVTVHAVGLDAAEGANGSTSGPIHFGGGRPGFFGSGSQANITDLPGIGGYVMRG